MFGKKRRADFEDDGYRDFRPRMPKRQRIPPIVQLCKEMMPDIKTIGESLKAYQDDIHFLSEAIVNEFGHEQYFNDALLQTFTSLVIEQPHKLPSIALLTMVVNTKNQEAGKSILNHFFSLLQKNLDNTHNDEFEVNSFETGPWNKIKLITRFLAILSPMIIREELFAIYKSLFTLSIDLNNIDENKRNPLAEAIYTNTLLNIPYFFYFNRNDQDLKQNVEELIQFVENSFKVNTNDYNLLSLYNNKKPYETVELIQLVLPNVKKFLANEMEQLNQFFLDNNDLLTEQTGDSGFNEPLILPTIEELSNFYNLDRGFGSIDSMWKTPRYNFHVYLPNSSGEFETVLPITSYAGQLLKDMITDIVQSMEFNRKEVAKQVISLNLFFKEGIFAQSGISINQLVEKFEEDPLTPTFKLEDLAVESILNLMFKLPTVSQPFAYFYTLLVEICQNSPKAIAPVFGRAFRFFYSHLADLDFEIRARYLDWFSIQMSNFSFSWKWNEWEKDSKNFGNVFYNPKMALAKNLIKKELRLTSTPSDVEDSLPEEFKQYLDSSLIPHEKIIEYYQSFFNDYEVIATDVKKHDFYFKQDSVPFSELVRNLIDYMHKQGENKKIEELHSIVEELKEKFGSIIIDFDRFIITLLIQTLAHSGSRSLSHANKYIFDFADDIKEIFEKLELSQDIKEYTVVEAIVRFWNTNSQTGFLIADALKHAGLTTSRTIFTFCFNEFENKNLGLIESTAIEAIFRNLSQDTLIAEGDASNFEHVFELLCVAVNDSVTALNIQPEEEITIPEITEDSEILDSDLERLNVLWKYQTAVAFIKSVLRKYSDEYKVLVEKFTNNLDTAIPHVPTREQLKTWLNEVREI